MGDCGVKQNLEVNRRKYLGDANVWGNYLGVWQE